MSASKADRHALIHREALEEFDEIQSAVWAERLQCLQDRRFYSIAGAQWEGPLGDQFEQKPRFEFNKTHLAVIRIFNEYRNNRITVDFQSKDGSSEDSFADVCDGLYRADEQACTAEEAYDNTYEEGVGGGMGAWRLHACYEDDEDEENDKQTIAMSPIFDADSCVFFDLGARRYDKADAKRCYVLTPFPRKAYEEEWGDDVASWDREIQQTHFDWCTPDIVWVCELYKVEEKSELVHFFRGLIGDEEKRVTDQELKDDPDYLTELQATGFQEVRQKRIKTRIIKKYTMSGGKMLDEEKIPGKCIPVVPFYGKRWIVDGIERCMGHVRLAKDAQRLLNMLLSWLAEMAARFDIEKPILTPEQIAGHAHMWAEDNVQKYPYLLSNGLLDAEGNPIPGSNVPMGYTKAPNIPPAMAALAEMANQALSDLLGNQQAGEQMQPNLSGKAVELIQNRLDMQVFIYMSNFAKSHKRAGEIWLSMKRELTTEEGRRMKTVGTNGEPGTTIVNQPFYDAKKGAQFIKHDFAKASYGVVADVGPSSSSKRSATVRAVTGMMQLTQNPEDLEILTGVALMNMEGEGLADVNKHYRAKMVRKGVIEPTEEEKAQIAQEQANAQPDPNSQYLMAAAQEAESAAAQNRAKTVQTIADADLKRAQTAKTMAETMGAHQDQQIASAQALQGILSGADQQAGVLA